MTLLRQRMLEDLRIRNYAPSTVECLFQPVHEKQNPRCVLGAEIQLGDSRAQERLARTCGHFKEKSVLRRRSGFLQRVDGVHLVIA